MSESNDQNNELSDNSSGIECISLESEDNVECLSGKSESIDEQEIQYLSSNIIENRFNGEDLCERESIERRNGIISINDYNKQYIQMMLNKEIDRDIQMESLINELRESDSDSTDCKIESDDDLLEDNFQAKNWIPNVISRPIEPDIDFENGYYLDPNEIRMDACLRYRSDSVMKIPPPFESLNTAFCFNKKFMSRLKQFDCISHNLQLHLWPFILKGFSLSCISGPKTGKTNAYTIPLMCWFDTNEIDSNIRVGSIVICSSTRKTYQIAREAKKWRESNEKSKVRIVVMNSSNEKKQLDLILNGCDILITTPSPLVRCIQSHVIETKNTRCLILDDADISLALHRKDILDIYLAFAKSKEKNHENYENHENDENVENGEKSAKDHKNIMAFQTLVFSQKWTRDVEWFYREVQHLPILIFASYSEATIAFGIETNIEYFEENNREKSLEELLKKVGHKEHIAIICRTIDEINYLRRIIKKPLNNAIVVTEETNHFDLQNFSKSWKKGNKILLITDSAIKMVFGFNCCKCIIHYKLPNDFNDFGERFRIMKQYFKQFKSPLIQHLAKDLVSYVLVSSADRYQIPELISYLKRLNIQIPEILSNFCHYESRKLCTYYSSLGKCPFICVQCFDRHLFNEFDRPNVHLPQTGQIKIVISYVCGANHFFFRINEFRDESQSSGIWQKMNPTFDELKPKLNEFINHEFNTLNEFLEEEVYGISVRGEVLRVKISRQLGEEELYFYQEYDPTDVSKRVELFCIDYGHKFYSFSRQLFALPLELKSFPPFAYRGYLFGIKPLDNEVEWDFRSTQRLYELVDNFRITQITAWVLKQLNGIFWLNRLEVRKTLRNATVCVNSDPIQTLKDENLVVEHNNKLSKFNNDYNKIVNIWHCNRLNGISYNVKLDEEWNRVVVIDFVSINEMYVMYENRLKRLEHLENKWKSNMNLLEPIKEITNGQICLYKYYDRFYNEYSINRSKVMSINEESITLFLVDHGETLQCNSKQDIYRIQDIHVQELPFQAIKVQLFGVKQLKPITYDLICELTRDENDAFKLVIASIVDNQNDINSVRLLVAKDKNELEFVSITKLLVDLNYVQYIDGEENNEMVLKIQEKIENDNEIEDQYLENIEKEMIDNFCKDFLLKSLNLKEDEDIDNGVKDKKAFKMSNVMKRLQMIKEKKDENNMNTNEEEEEEEDYKDSKVFPDINYKSGDFDYVLPENHEIAYYEPNDDENDSLHSDEDALLEGEEDF